MRVNSKLKFVVTCFWPKYPEIMGVFIGIKNAMDLPSAERHTANWKGIMKALPPQRIAKPSAKK